MSRYVTNNAAKSSYCEEIAVVDSKAGRIEHAMILQKSTPQNFDLPEERQEVSSVKRRSSKIRAMTMKFEQAATVREEQTKQRVHCGSPVAERKRQLQQKFFTKDEVLREESSQISNGSKDALSRKSSAGCSKLVNTTINNHMQTSSSVADKKKMFENAFKKDKYLPEVATSGLSRNESTEPSTTFTMTKSDSEFSPLQYHGSLLSDDTFRGRDDCDEPRLSEVSNNLEEPGLQTSGQPENSFTSTLSPNNSFQEALNDIVKSFEKTVRPPKRNFICKEERDSEETNFTLFPPQPMFVMETTRLEDPSPVSNLTSFDTGPPGQSSSRGSSIVGDFMTTGDDCIRSCSSPKSTSVPVKKVARDISPTELLPDSSLFSTVDQEEKREKTNIQGQVEASANNDEALGSTAKQFFKGSNAPSNKVDPKAPTPTKDPPENTRKESKIEQTELPIKGILKNPGDTTSPVSAARSWYSFATSPETSDVSQQLSPLQDAPLAMPMLQKSRCSIGACVNAHLAENPHHPASEVTSQCSGSPKSAHISYGPRRRNSTSSLVASGRRRAESPSSMDPQMSLSGQNHRDLNLAEAMSDMANTASNAMLDVFVDAADKVVVSPLISIFNCVDASENMLCQGASIAAEMTVDRNKTSRRRIRHGSSRVRYRKFQA